MQGSDLLRCVLTHPQWVLERNASDDRWEDKWLTNERELGWHALTDFYLFIYSLIFPELFSQKLLTNSVQLQRCQFLHSEFTCCHSGSFFCSFLYFMCNVSLSLTYSWGKKKPPFHTTEEWINSSLNKNTRANGIFLWNLFTEPCFITDIIDQQYCNK